MAHFRLEAVLDDETGLYSLEAYYPAEAIQPFTRTRPRFRSEREAFEFAKEKFSEAFPDKPPARDLKPN
jgi:hypothetical protein